MNTKAQNLTMKELEELGEKLSAWAESDEFFEALETATLLPRNAESIARSNEILKAAGRGRPTLVTAVKGEINLCPPPALISPGDRSDLYRKKI